MVKRFLTIAGVIVWAAISIVSAAGCNVSKPAETSEHGHDHSVDKSDAAESKVTDTISPEKRDPNRLWCNEHGVYEDECVICHPELAKKKTSEERDPNRLWCNEHGVYEDECVICHPELADKKQTSDASATQRLMCTEHNVYEDECGICRPELLANASTGKGLKVRFTSADSTTKAGIVTALPGGSSERSNDELLGKVSFNRNALAMVTPLAGGVVREVFKDVGDSVSEGEVLATLQSLDVAEVKNELATVTAEAELARQTLAREQDLFKREISARQDLEQAQAAVKVSDSNVVEARQHLLNLGLLPEEVDAIARNQSTGSLLAVRAPFAGTLIERSAVAGSAVEAGHTLFQVADLSTMWMEISVPELKLSSLQIGALVQARFDAYPGIAFEGEITWVAPSVSQETRMVQARLLLQNPQGLLRDGLFGRAALSQVSASAPMSVPVGAVQDIDGTPVIFTKLASDLFEARVVSLGATDRGYISILEGLLPDDEIVTDGSYTMKSELLKARLGAGCTDH